MLVSAAAGSGKTAVLVERIIRIITEGDNPCDIDKLLVLTFTNAAASEMRERISAAVSKKMDEFPDNEHLAKQLALINRAKITTIHSFCLDVIRENYTAIDIDPAFRVADETEIWLIKSDTVDELFEKRYSDENNEMFLNLIEIFGDKTKDASLKDLIVSIFDFSRSMPFPNDWLNDSCNRFKVDEGTLFSDTEIWSMTKDYIEFELDGLKKINEKAIALTKEKDGPSEYLNAMLDDEDIILRLKNALGSGAEAFYDEVNNVSFGNIGRKSKNTPKEAAEKVSFLRGMVKDGVTEIKNKFMFKHPELMLEDTIKLYPVAEELKNLVQEFGALFAEKKREKLIIDFGDIEHMCLSILVRKDDNLGIMPTEAALEYQNEFFEVMTDEYQDSNDVQELILSVVSKSFKGENNRFMVGDVKQSIYRFRQANPQIFIDKYEGFRNQEEKKHKNIDLFKNFRSRRNILDCINFLFMQLMTKELGEVSYDEKAALYYGGNFIENDNLNIGGKTELIILDGETEEDDEEFDIDSKEAEAYLIAEKINSIVNKENFYVTEKNGKDTRPAEYRDIVILMRSPSSWSKIIADVFAKCGIPVFIENENDFFASKEVSTMVSFLKIIDNPRQDIPLLSVLRSPIYDISNELLLNIKRSGGEKSFYDCLVKFAEDCGDNNISAFLNDLNRLRDLSEDMPIDELVWQIYMETGFYDYVGLSAGGEVGQSNLRLLHSKACEYKKSSFKGLFHFIRYIEKIEKSESDIGGAASFGENENIVRVMSIHKSKGLEFPVVIVAGLGKKFNKTDTRGKLLMHHKLGFGLKYVDLENRVSYDTLIKNLVAKKINDENLSEELRILYVALTRAREKLILTGRVNSIKKQAVKWTLLSDDVSIELDSYLMKNAQNMLDWICSAIARHKDGELLNDLAGARSMDMNNGLYGHTSKWDINVINMRNLTANIEYAENNSDEVIVDKIKNDDIKARLLKTYDFEDCLNIPLNVTVSDIKKSMFKNDAAEEFDKGYNISDFVEEKDNISATDKGNAVHKLMECLNFKKEYSAEKIDGEVRALVEAGQLTEKEAQIIDRNKIMSFLSSDAGKLLRESDIIYKEIPFAMLISQEEAFNGKFSDEKEILIHGIIDCFCVKDNEAVLIDYKTDYVKDNNEQILIDRYSVQLKIYKKALEKITKLNVSKCILYSFYLNKNIYIN